MLRQRKGAGQLEVESLEGRIALSTATHSLHPAVAAHVSPIHGTAAHAKAVQVSPGSSPVLVNLTPDATGVTITSVGYDARVHLITVKGIVNVISQSTNDYGGFPVTYPTTQYIGLSATQAVSRLQSVSGYQYSSETIADATVTQVPFIGRILASSGQFESGTVNISVTTSSAYGGGYQVYSVLARMHNAKAY